MACRRCSASVPLDVPESDDELVERLTCSVDLHYNFVEVVEGKAHVRRSGYCKELAVRVQN